MNKETHPDPPIDQLAEAADGIARRTADAAMEAGKKATVAAKEVAGVVEGVAGDVINATKDAAWRATDKTKEVYEAAALKAEDALATSKEYVRQNPVPVVLGAIAFGVAIGYLLLTPRRKPTFSDSYAEEPVAAVREAILEALAPVTQRVHRGYDSARDGAGRVMDRVHDVGSSRHGDSFSDQISRIGSTLKFW